MSAPARSHPRRFRASLPAQVALCALLASAGVTPASPTIENGGFEHGFAGWRVEETKMAVGEAIARAQVTLQDVFGPGSGQYVGFTIANSAAGTSGGSSSITGLSMRHRGIVSARFLDFEAFGFWTFTAFGEVFITNCAEVVVRGKGPAAGKEASFALIASEFHPINKCGAGIVADFAVFPGTRTIDLLAGGFQLGDPMEIEVRWDARVAANGASCNQADLDGGISFDDFVLRN